MIRKEWYIVLNKNATWGLLSGPMVYSLFIHSPNERSAKVWCIQYALGEPESCTLATP